MASKKSKSSKKKFLGAMSILAFVAAFSFLVSTYIMSLNVSLTAVAIISVVITTTIIILMYVSRSDKKPKKKK